MNNRLLIPLILIPLLFTSKIRGIRNNNLLNIKHDEKNKWVGQIGVDPKNFVIFSDSIYSIRATFKILISYRKRGINTISDIISTFAPSYENPTQKYINFISNNSNINPYQQLKPGNWPRIIQLMIKMEVGKNVDLSTIYKAFKMV